ncbi:MAG: DUF2933 domain-containing protein [Thermoleophilia bacterium]|nr:DUF2933 domain-containing protein [Thermoleophilia bacterium]
MEWFGIVALLLMCPIAMIFMMRGMGHGKERASGGTDPLAGMSKEQLHELTRRVQNEITQRESGAGVSGGT